MRQFYLLLAEWYAQLKLEDARIYRLCCCWLTNAPAFEALFPMWAESEPGDFEYTEDDDGNFQRVLAEVREGVGVNGNWSGGN